MKSKTNTLTRLFYANDLEKIVEEDTRKQVAFVESISGFLTMPEPITYSAFNIDDEIQSQGGKKVETIEIELLVTEEQYDELKAIQDAKTNGYWAIQLPKETAKEEGKPLIWYFIGICHIGISEIAIDDMLKSKLTIYRNLST